MLFKIIFASIETSKEISRYGRRKKIYMLKTLLKQAQNIFLRHKVIAEETGKGFNIFNIIGITTKEVYLCRLLCELINPNGQHCLNRVYLDLFLKYVLDLNPQEFKTVSIEQERVIEDLRRIDICINVVDKNDNSLTIPIEVKINAKDQDNQVCDYCHSVNNSQIYYLTKCGEYPANESIGSLAKTQIKCISWSKHILNWLDECIYHKATIERMPIKIILQQFKSTIQQFIGQSEGATMEISELLLENLENFENAQSISNSLDVAKEEIMKGFRSKLKEQLTSNSYMVLEPKSDDEPRFSSYNYYWHINITNNKKARITYEKENVYICINYDSKTEKIEEKVFTEENFYNDFYVNSDKTINQFIIPAIKKYLG